MMMKSSRSMTGSVLVVISILFQVFEMSEAGVINLNFGLQSTSGSFAGNEVPATSASLSNPTSCWLNTNGEAFIGDNGNFRIRKVDSTGTIGTYFGTGGVSVDGNGGPATSASGQPYVVSGDTAGNIYFSDTFSQVVRKIDSSQIVTAFAGGGTLGSTSSSADNGAAATSSAFSGAGSICLDTIGDVYIVNSGLNKIKKVSTSTHILTYVAGTGSTASTDISANNGDGGPATSALLTSPVGLYVDSVSMLYFSSYGSGIIRQINLVTGIVVTFAGGTDGTSGYSGDGGKATSALLQTGNDPFIGGDRDGRIYFSAKSNSNVRVIDASGIINRFAGDSAGSSGYTGNGGEATSALLDKPFHIFVQDSFVYITENGNNVVRSVAITVSSTGSKAPSIGPTMAPSCKPTLVPSAAPSVVPSIAPSQVPTVAPTVVPTRAPSVLPTLVPSALPTAVPSLVPSAAPSCVPSIAPSSAPSVGPTWEPTVFPTISPSCVPSVTPSQAPSALPTVAPSVPPSILPSLMPSVRPTCRPSRVSVRSEYPTLSPTVSPTLPIVVISFDSGIHLHNVSTPSLDETSQNAVTSAVAATLNIDNDQVSYVSQTEIDTTDGRRHLSTRVGYEIVMTVNVIASTADFTDAVNKNGSYLYDRLSNRLLEAVESNMFVSTVREISASLGATSTLHVQYVNLTLTGFEDVIPESDVSSTHHSDLKVGDFAGIVIGIVLSFLVMIVCFYFCLRYLKVDYQDDSKV